MGSQADFSYFFDIGSRRRCYVAPERFFEGSGQPPEGPLLPSMDIFSAGCVIAELFLDGRALFDLSQVPPTGGSEAALRLTSVFSCTPTSTFHTATLAVLHFNSQYHIVVVVFVFFVFVIIHSRDFN